VCEANMEYWMSHVYRKKEWIVCNMYLATKNPKKNNKTLWGIRLASASAAFLAHN
jgi:hypothetical protein